MVSPHSPALPVASLCSMQIGMAGVSQDQLDEAREIFGDGIQAFDLMNKDEDDGIEVRLKFMG